MAGKHTKVKSTVSITSLDVLQTINDVSVTSEAYEFECVADHLDGAEFSA